MYTERTILPKFLKI